MLYFSVKNILVRAEARQTITAITNHVFHMERVPIYSVDSNDNTLYVQEIDYLTEPRLQKKKHSIKVSNFQDDYGSIKWAAQRNNLSRFTFPKSSLNLSWIKVCFTLNVKHLTAAHPYQEPHTCDCSLLYMCAARKQMHWSSLRTVAIQNK